MIAWLFNILGFVKNLETSAVGQSKTFDRFWRLFLPIWSALPEVNSSSVAGDVLVRQAKKTWKKNKLHVSLEILQDSLAEY